MIRFPTCLAHVARVLIEEHPGGVDTDTAAQDIMCSLESVPDAINENNQWLSIGMHNIPIASLPSVPPDEKPWAFNPVDGIIIKLIDHMTPLGAYTFVATRHATAPDQTAKERWKRVYEYCYHEWEYPPLITDTFRCGHAASIGILLKAYQLWRTRLSKLEVETRLERWRTRERHDIDNVSDANLLFQSLGPTYVKGAIKGPRETSMHIRAKSSTSGLHVDMRVPTRHLLLAAGAATVFVQMNPRTSVPKVLDPVQWFER
jgi:hypothetical protein